MFQLGTNCESYVIYNCNNPCKLFSKGSISFVIFYKSIKIGVENTEWEPLFVWYSSPYVVSIFASLHLKQKNVFGLSKVFYFINGNCQMFYFTNRPIRENAFYYINWSLCFNDFLHFIYQF